MTTGGGGDGEALIDWVLRAYETDPLLPYPALLVLGPFMQPERAGRVPGARRAPRQRVDAITFDAHLEHAGRGRARGGGDGRLQHLLRDPLVRQARADRAAHRAAPGAVHPRVARARAAGPGPDAGRRRAPRSRRPWPPTLRRAAAAPTCPPSVVVPGLLDGLETDRRLVSPWLAPAAAGRGDATRLASAGVRAAPDWCAAAAVGAAVAVVLKGYPRLSETFIAQEIAGAGAARPGAA